MSKSRQDNIDIVDALRYSVNRLRHTMNQFKKSLDNTAKSFVRLADIFGNPLTPYHKTKQFRRHMYYRRYFRNSHRSNKQKKRRH